MDEQPTQKQQLVELLRSANNILVTTNRSPSPDDIAAAIALSQMLEKMGKRIETVISSGVDKLSFLPIDRVHNKFEGIRDFVIELDTSKTEADKLKYIPEGKFLKVYITPYNGNFSRENVSFSYGDYHCDLVVGVGVGSASNVDQAISNQRDLLTKTKTALIKAGDPQSGESTPNTLLWADPQATGGCEMLMSLSEALQPGLLDNQIATSLLTGLLAVTNHFTGSNTTPKVMTMAAQLLAAGADQASIVKQLQPVGDSKNSGGKDHELKPSHSENLPHQKQEQNNNQQHDKKPAQPQQSKPAPPANDQTNSSPAPAQPRPQPESKPEPKPEVKPEIKAEVKPSPEKVIEPPRPQASPVDDKPAMPTFSLPSTSKPTDDKSQQPPVAPLPVEPSVRSLLESESSTTEDQSGAESPETKSTLSHSTPKLDIEAARKQVEEAVKDVTVDTPTNLPSDSPPSSGVQPS